MIRAWQRSGHSQHYCGYLTDGGSVAEWLACWTQAQKARVQIAAKLVAALLRAAGVTAGLVESNGSLQSGL